MWVRCSTVDSVPAMAVTIRIPTTLRPLTSGKPEVDVEADTVGEALALSLIHI